MRAVPKALRALRGATTVDADTTEQVFERVTALLGAMFDANDIAHEDLVSVIFTATDDVHSVFPAAAARKFGLGDVPLLCARELDIEDGTPLCIRVLMHLESARPKSDMHHVYLEGARTLRDDLPE
jgi:chorismate mutase